MIAGIDMQAPVHVDSRRIKKTVAERDAIPEGVRFKGLEVFVEETKIKYRLEGGVTNDCWVDVNELILGQIKSTDEKAERCTHEIEALKGISTPELTPVEGKYGASTSFATSAKLAYSGIIELTKGQTLIFSCTTQITSSIIVSALFSCNSLEDTRPRTVLVNGLGSYQEYTYTATADVEYVGFNYKIADGYECRVVSPSEIEKTVEKNTSDIEEIKSSLAKETLDVEYSAGYLQYSTGKPAATTSATAKHTSLFALNKGETIEFTARGYSTGAVAVLYEYVEEGTGLQVLIRPFDNDYVTYTYTETKERGYYKASSYNAVEKEFKIIKYVSAEKANEVKNSTSAENHDYLKQLFRKAIFIGDSLTKGVMGTDNQVYEQANYPYYISKLTGWEITNAGHPSYTTQQFWENDLKTLDFTDKDICFIYLGQNGGFTDGSETDIQAVAYCNIIEYIKAQNPDMHIFVLVGGGTNATAVLPLIAEKYGLPCLDIYRNKYFTVGGSELYHPYKEDGESRDLVHFGRIGYLDLAKSVLNMTFDYINEHKADFEYPYPASDESDLFGDVDENEEGTSYVESIAYNETEIAWRTEEGDVEWSFEDGILTLNGTVANQQILTTPEIRRTGTYIVGYKVLGGYYVDSNGTTHNIPDANYCPIAPAGATFTHGVEVYQEVEWDNSLSYIRITPKLNCTYYNFKIALLICPKDKFKKDVFAKAITGNVAVTQITPSVFDFFKQDVLYFSADGDDSYSGILPQYPKKTPWDYIRRGNCTVLLKGGDVFKAKSAIYVGDNVRIGSYGVGRAVVDGSVNASTAFVASETEGLYTCEIADSDLGFISLDGGQTWNRKRVLGTTEITTGEWYFDGNTITLCSDCDLTGIIPIYTKPIKGFVSGGNNIKIDNLEVRNFGVHGFDMQSSNTVISNNYVYNIGGAIYNETTKYGNGIQVWLSGVKNVFVVRNIVADCIDAGITPQGIKSTGSETSSDNVAFLNNVVYRCAWNLEYYNGYSSGNINYTRFLIADNFLRDAMDITEGHRYEAAAIYPALICLRRNYGVNNIVFKNNIGIGSTDRALLASPDNNDGYTAEGNILITNGDKAITSPYSSANSDFNPINATVLSSFPIVPETAEDMAKLGYYLAMGNELYNKAPEIAVVFEEEVT